MIAPADQRLFVYFAAVTLAVLLAMNVMPAQDNLAGDVRSKVVHYRANADAYDFLFIGDSRTYCGVHPERLRGPLGGRVANLATWALWLPTQYPQIQDIIEAIPDHTTVVWSVGYQNFHPCLGCETKAYPIGDANAALYNSLGIPRSLYEDNVRDLKTLDTWVKVSNPGRLSFAQLYENAVRWLQTPLTVPQSTEQLTPQTHLVLSAQDQGVANAALVYHQGTPTSIGRTFTDGGYERIELQPEFFRAKQAAHRQEQTMRAQPRQQFLEPAFFKLFERILDLFAKHNVRLIVNIMEEAPHTYIDRDHLLRERSLLDTRVGDAVIRRGFKYTRIDFDQLSSADYFDYNHLNSQGAEKFTALLAAKLREVEPSVATSRR